MDLSNSILTAHTGQSLDLLCLSTTLPATALKRSMKLDQPCLMNKLPSSNLYLSNEYLTSIDSSGKHLKAKMVENLMLVHKPSVGLSTDSICTKSKPLTNPLLTGSNTLSQNKTAKRLLATTIIPMTSQTSSHCLTPIVKRTRLTNLVNKKPLALSTTTNTRLHASSCTVPLTLHSSTLSTNREIEMGNDDTDYTVTQQRDRSIKRCSTLTKEDDPKQPRMEFEPVSVEIDDYQCLTVKIEETVGCKINQTMVLKRTFIASVSASLLSAPNWRNKHDDTRQALLALAQSVAAVDAEFVLKVALYTRCELNIRSTANFLLSYAAYHPTCRNFIKKYFSAIIRLPSDWIDVAELYQIFDDTSIHFGSLPAALRRAMAAKFPEFDQYQLGKYNKESSRKKKSGLLKNVQSSKKAKIEDHTPVEVPEENEGSKSENENVEEGMEVHYDSDFEDQKEIIRKTFTLKQLIRKIHVTRPVENIMCLIGRKYPSSPEEFRENGLDGIWDEARSGKRMKLPTPETWETQVSMKGNVASTWEALLDHKKLPFMAMLRNLRNMIKAGISEKHHALVLKRLTDEQQVIRSRQFPFRFFSAYQVLQILETDFHSNEKTLVESTVNASDSAMQQSFVRGRGAQRRGARGRGRGRGGRAGVGFTNKESKYSPVLLQRYKKALDGAVKIATVYNITPISGRTLILVKSSHEMSQPCTSARGLGPPRTVLEVGILLALMCKYSCEDATFIVYGSAGYQEIELEPGTILENMASVQALAGILDGGGDVRLPDDHLQKILSNEIHLDNFILLSVGLDMLSSEGKTLQFYLEKYRRVLNSQLLFASIDLTGSKAGLAKSAQPTCDHDVFLSGFSDQILKYIAEQGNERLMLMVENIDSKYELVKKPQGLQVPIKSLSPSMQIVPKVPRWKNVRVFISSTFRDFHGERDLLSRFVFPELRRRAGSLFVNVLEIDFRWGIPEDQAAASASLVTCLQEAARSQFFIGLLGERYGSVPDRSNLPDLPELDWLKSHSTEASITELEIYGSVLCDPQRHRENAFFFFRDPSVISEIPAKFASDFQCEDGKAECKLKELKKEILSKGLETFNNYPSSWGGVRNGQPITGNLLKFGERVLNNLWNAISKQYTVEEMYVDELSHELAVQRGFVEQEMERFTGRNSQLGMLKGFIEEYGTSIVVVTGSKGIGKSSFMAGALQYLKHTDVAPNALYHFTNASRSSKNFVCCLRLLLTRLNQVCGTELPITSDYKTLYESFQSLQSISLPASCKNLVFLLDGIDQFDNCQVSPIDFIPRNLPPRIKFVLSVDAKSPLLFALKSRKAKQLELQPMAQFERCNLVRKTLALRRKVLDESAFNNQMAVLVGKRQAGSPIFLEIACSELFQFGVFEKIMLKLRSIPQTTVLLVKSILARLLAIFEPGLVAAAFGLLMVSEHGLTKRDLHGALSRWQFGNCKTSWSDWLSFQVPAHQMLPPLQFSDLVNAISGLIAPNSKVLQIVSAEVLQAIRGVLVKSSADTKMYHYILSAHYMHECDEGLEGRFQGTNVDAFGSLPFHLRESGCWDDLTFVICNLGYIRKAFQFNLKMMLLEFFQDKKSSSVQFNRFLASEAVAEYREFVVRNSHVLASFPVMTVQMALDEPVNSLPWKHAKSSLLDIQAILCEKVNKSGLVSQCQLIKDDFSAMPLCIACSPSMDVVAAGFEDGVVRMLDTSTCKEGGMMIGHSDVITDVSFIGAHKICSSSADNSLSIWSVSGGHRLHLLKGHTRRVTACAASSDARLVASVSWDASVKIWNASNGSCDSTFLNKRPLTSVSFHPEGDLIVVGSWDCTVRVWSVLHQTRKAILRGHLTSVRQVKYNNAGTHIASASLDGEIKLWSAVNGQKIGNFLSHAVPVTALAFSFDNRHLLSGATDGRIKVWSQNIGQLIFSSRSEKGTPAISISICSSKIAVGLNDGSVAVYDIEFGELLKTTKLYLRRVNAVKIDAMGEYIISGSDDANATVIHSSPNNKSKVPLFCGTNAVLCVDAGIKLFAIGSEDSTVRVYRQPNWHQKTASAPLELCGHEDAVTGVSFSSDDTKLVSAGRDKTMRVWTEGPTFVLGRVIANCHQDMLTGICFSEAANLVATAGNDLMLKVWDISSGTEKRCMEHQAMLTGVAYRSGCISTSSTDGTVSMWSHKGTLISMWSTNRARVNQCDLIVSLSHKKSFEHHDDSITSDWAAASALDEWTEAHRHRTGKLESANSVMVASCAEDGHINLWSALDADCLDVWTGHSGGILGVASSSGATVSVGEDARLRLWRPFRPAREEVPEHSSDVTACQFFRGTRKLASCSCDGVVKLWDCKAEMKLEFSLQLCQSRINCMIVVNDDLLIVGNNSGEVVMAMVKVVSEQLTLRVLGKCKASSPVTSICCIDKMQFGITTWFHSLEKVTINELQPFNVSIAAITDRSQDWTLASCKAGMLIVATVTADHSINIHSSLTERNCLSTSVNFAHADGKAVPWMKCIAAVKNCKGKKLFAIGDGHGYLTIAAKSPIFCKKVHEGAINQVISINNILLTASEDGKIKFWKHDKDCCHLQQVGMYECHAPARAVDLKNGKLVIGTQLGNVLLLTMNKLSK